MPVRARGQRLKLRFLPVKLKEASDGAECGGRVQVANRVLADGVGAGKLCGAGEDGLVLISRGKGAARLSSSGLPSADVAAAETGLSRPKACASMTMFLAAAASASGVAGGATPNISSSLAMR